MFLALCSRTGIARERRQRDGHYPFANSLADACPSRRGAAPITVADVLARGFAAKRELQASQPGSLRPIASKAEEPEEMDVKRGLSASR